MRSPSRSQRRILGTSAPHGSSRHGSRALRLRLIAVATWLRRAARVTQPLRTCIALCAYGVAAATFSASALAQPAAQPASAPAPSAQATSYENFRAAVYARAYEVEKMADRAWLQTHFDRIQKDVKVSKVYLETHRDKLIVAEPTLKQAIAFFRERGITVAGGITLTIDEPNRFETFCYSNPEHRAWVKRVIEYTARHFDEIILDDFYFTSCKSKGEIRAKGKRSWSEYRRHLLRTAANQLILGPAKKVNRRVEVVIKYPNWYDHFQELGFDLEAGPKQFDGIYTGTETRDSVRSAQHLQPYHGYQIVRYFNHLAPGRNGGGWVDTGGMGTLDRYAEQLWLTLFAKAPEITLFDFRQLIRPVLPSHRGKWQDGSTSLDFDDVVAPYRDARGRLSKELRLSRAAGWSLAHVDPVLGKLGTPLGVASYKPYHSSGEAFLHNFLGGIGIPIDLQPAFPKDAPLVLLTRAAAADPKVVKKIRTHLESGKDVVITSGLLEAIQDRGLSDVANLRVTSRKALVDTFLVGRSGMLTSRKKMLIPQIDYYTNDSWELISTVDGKMGWPLLHDADYAGSHLYVLTVPDNFSDLYALPPAALRRIRQTVMSGLPVRVDGPSEMSVFLYDNQHLVVSSFNDRPTRVTLVADGNVQSLRNVMTGEVLRRRVNPPNPPGAWAWSRDPDAGKVEFRTQIPAHSFAVFEWTTSR